MPKYFSPPSCRKNLPVPRKQNIQTYKKNLYILAFAQISRNENVHPKAKSSSVTQKIVHGKAVSLQWLWQQMLEGCWETVRTDFTSLLLAATLTQSSYLFQLLFELLCHCKWYILVYNLKQEKKDGFIFQIIWLGTDQATLRICLKRVLHIFLD